LGESIINPDPLFKTETNLDSQKEATPRKVSSTISIHTQTEIQVTINSIPFELVSPPTLKHLELSSNQGSANDIFGEHTPKFANVKMNANPLITNPINFNDGERQQGGNQSFLHFDIQPKLKKQTSIMMIEGSSESDLSQDNDGRKPSQSSFVSSNVSSLNPDQSRYTGVKNAMSNMNGKSERIMPLRRTGTIYNLDRFKMKDEKHNISLVQKSSEIFTKVIEKIHSTDLDILKNNSRVMRENTLIRLIKKLYSLSSSKINSLKKKSISMPAYVYKLMSYFLTVEKTLNNKYKGVEFMGLIRELSRSSFTATSLL